MSLPRSDAGRGGRTNCYDAVLAVPFGRVGVRVEGSAVCEIAFLPERTPTADPRDGVSEALRRQLARYLRDPSFRFDVPLATVGSPFQRRVWEAISAIPSGRTRSYGEIARDIASAPRAVGQACGENRYPLVIPCHRVVAAGGIGGFAHKDGGYLLRIKRWLLAHEGAMREERERNAATRCAARAVREAGPNT